MYGVKILDKIPIEIVGPLFWIHLIFVYTKNIFPYYIYLNSFMYNLNTINDSRININIHTCIYVCMYTYVCG